MITFHKKDHYKSGVTKTRSLLKSITWRIVGTLDTMMISYLLTGKLNIALSIGSIEIFTKMILYFFHERIWNFIRWGRREEVTNLE